MIAIASVRGWSVPLACNKLQLVTKCAIETEVSTGHRGVGGYPAHPDPGVRA